jgi:DNA repair exonuclease SbcCD ATPase subunit
MSDPIPVDQPTEPAGDVLAWLNDEQKHGDRWMRTESGVLRFTLTGPELMRLRRQLEQQGNLQRLLDQRTQEYNDILAGKTVAFAAPDYITQIAALARRTEDAEARDAAHAQAITALQETIEHLGHAHQQKDDTITALQEQARYWEDRTNVAEYEVTVLRKEVDESESQCEAKDAQLRTQENELNASAAQLNLLFKEIADKDARIAEYEPRPSGVPPPPPRVPVPAFDYQDSKMERDHRKQFSRVDLDTATKPLHVELEAINAQLRTLQAERDNDLEQSRKTVEFHRDMAARFAEDRDKLKHQLRTVGQALRDLRQKYWQTKVGLERRHSSNVLVQLQVDLLRENVIPELDVLIQSLEPKA